MTKILARTFSVIGLSVVVTGITACGGASKNAKSPTQEAAGSGGTVEVGKPAPDLSIQTLNGKGTVSLASLQGKIAVIDFWATWCAPCKASFPKLEALSKRHAGKVEIVGISVDDEDKKSEIIPFAKDKGATFAIGWDDGHAIANRWHVETMPTTIIIDATGTVRHVHAGYHDDEPEQIDKELLALVNESPSKKGDSAVASTDSSKDAASKDSTTSTDDSAKPAEDPPPPPSKKTAKPGKKPGKKPPAKKKKDPSAA
jgi:cytochrome c biogenesis protein CcmG/thiol:disulfide interchange protein DsbE